MERLRQSLDEIVSTLSEVLATWQDPLASETLKAIRRIPDFDRDSLGHCAAMLDDDFKVGILAVRLMVDLSKDVFDSKLREDLGQGGIGITRFRKDRAVFLEALEALGVLSALEELSSRPVDWRDLLAERLKAGRGSAIKGQRRGRRLEDFTEQIVRRVFGPDGYDCRCRFVGKNGQSTEKTDFAIPSKTDANVLIEAKAYGATGSKQTDVLGDLSRMTQEKRHDTALLLVTDGLTWKSRLSDLAKLVKMQNEGAITRIYTQRTAGKLHSDLETLRMEYGL